MKKLILAGILLANSQMVLATNWVDTYASSKEHKEKNYVDYDSIQGYYFNSYDKTNYYVTAWVKHKYPVAQTLNNGKLYREETAYLYVDCLNKKISVGESVYHTSTGKLVGSQKGYVSTYSSDNWNRITPDTVGYGISVAICTYYQVKSQQQGK